jgi:aspartyl-tRNA(Asn)/glutamyl-tRNA(Gln) amidotransferase subunit B
MQYEPVIGLEVHAELSTRSKMFCACQVIDSVQARPNVAVCPVCAGMPGVLPVLNQKAVEYGMRVALALECQVARTSIFARKNYFYPDLPKGYQISQYENPLAEHGILRVPAPEGRPEGRAQGDRTTLVERVVRIRRVHLEEDTGKLTHVTRENESFSLVDLNRAGVPLLEIVSEPDMHSPEEARAYAMELRTLLRCLGVNSGDMEKGVIRFEANVSLRPAGSRELGTRVEIKNLNSFRALERSCAYEIQRQAQRLDQGEKIVQETLGWDETNGVTLSQRSKEEAHDYRYFPEPDLPPLVVENEWIERVAAGLPELPRPKALRLQQAYGLAEGDAHLLAEDTLVADYFEKAVQAAPLAPPRTVANWITGELFGWLNQNGKTIEQIKVSPQELGKLVNLANSGEINLGTAKTVLAEMLSSGQPAQAIITAGNRQQVSDSNIIAGLVKKALAENPQELSSYLDGKETLANWFFGQVMRFARGQANPQVVRQELEKQLQELKNKYVGKN